MKSQTTRFSPRDAKITAQPSRFFAEQEAETVDIRRSNSDHRRIKLGARHEAVRRLREDSIYN